MTEGLKDFQLTAVGVYNSRQGCALTNIFLKILVIYVQLYRVAHAYVCCMINFLRVLPLLCCFSSYGQKQFTPVSGKKYQGLLWEITGNGLKKPSYVFGTMHVSSKLAFHLSDSFYYALKQVDAVALELNPNLWQGQMVKLDELNENYAAFIQTAGNDYVSESTFRIGNYENELKSALSTEPPAVNSLLYRSYKTRDDFEEDTFLDLYIFQAGRKLGKEAAGVEDYYESQKLVLEAYRDMAAEKKKKSLDLDGETMSSLLQKLQQAYRYGDLDLMDSIDNLLEKSAAFREKFLYKRNEIQANAIDSIIQHKSLFAGVGAAHLPGKRGIIELLRNKGYRLRAVKMADRDAAQKETINQLKVPVKFSKQQSEDLFYTVDVPGPLYSLKNSYQQMDRSQYADMSNGAYYLVSRIKTYASFSSQPGVVQKKVDSLLYEYIPGTILQKKSIERNGYPGYDISNRTRRGDLQRYHIYITPFEVVIFKMSGKGDYVKGPEASSFFNSIQLKPSLAKPVTYTPAEAGFSILLPQQPHVFYNPANDMRWEYEAVDKTNGEAFLIFRTAVHNYHFLEADSFDLALIETSFGGSENFEKQVSRRYSVIDGYPALLVQHKLKDGDFIDAAYIIKGAQYYVLAHRSRSAVRNNDFLKSFRLTSFIYPPAAPYEDSFLLIKTLSPVLPEIDNGIRAIVEKTADDAAEGNNPSGYISYWKKLKNGVFASKATGEMVSVQMQEYPTYFFIRDSVKFWENEIADFLNKDDMVLHHKKWFYNADGSKGYRFQVRDTGSSRAVDHLLMLKGRHIYTMSAVTDTLSATSVFLKEMFDGLEAHEQVKTENMMESKLSIFFADLFSNDSLVQKRARQSISNVYFGGEGAAGLFQSINRLSITNKNYFDSKMKLIAELGFIKDSINRDIPAYLSKIYEQTADTSLFQNEAIMGLARLKTTASFLVLKELVLADPPIFENESEYDLFFDNLADSLPLSKLLFPQLLQLSSLADYKENISNLLVSLVDSGHVKGADYAAFFPGIFIDAKVAWKKQQAKEEKIMEANNKKDPADEDDVVEVYSGSSNGYSLNNYAVLLMPFYESNKNIPTFFDRLLKSKDEVLRINIAALLLRNNKAVPDSIFYLLAANDKYRGILYNQLEKAGRLDKFPKKFSTQLDLARSFLVMQNQNTPIDSMLFIKKVVTNIKNESGHLYFFKYRVKKTDDWKIGISGLQPLDEKKLSSNDRFVRLTDKKLLSTTALDEQLNEELKKLIFPYYNSGKNFFKTEGDYFYNKYLGQEE